MNSAGDYMVATIRRQGATDERRRITAALLEKYGEDTLVSLSAVLDVIEDRP